MCLSLSLIVLVLEDGNTKGEALQRPQEEVNVGTCRVPRSPVLSRCLRTWWEVPPRSSAALVLEASRLI